MGIIRVVLLAMGTVCLGMLLKNTQSSFAMMVSFAVGILIFIWITKLMSEVLTQFQALQSYTTIPPKYIVLLLRVLGIAYLTQFTTDICRENGYTAVAGQVENFSKITIMLLSMPMVMNLLDMVLRCVS